METDAFFGEVKMERGRPRLYINGEERPPVIYAMHHMFHRSDNNPQVGQRNVKNFAGLGIDFIQIDTSLGFGWKKGEKLDIGFALQEIDTTLKAAPDAKIMIRLHVIPPYWWLHENPGEMTVYSGWETKDSGEDRRGDDCDHVLRPSFASKKMAADTNEKLKELCEALEDTPEGRRVVSIQIAYGIYGEWHNWGFDWNPDYSQPMEEAFREYLAERYHNDGELQAAWGDPRASVKTAVLAPVEERKSTASGSVRDPVSGQRSVDSLRCMQLCGAKLLLGFAETLKKNWKRPLIVGAFNGYFFNFMDTGLGEAILGHLEVQKVLSSPYIDFIASPLPYLENREIGGFPASRAVMESVRLNGKLYLTEMDERPIGDGVGGDPAEYGKSIAVLRRNCLEPVLRGGGFWYYDHTRNYDVNPDGTYRKTGWWDCPVLLEEIDRFHKAITPYCTKPYEQAADVLLVYDTESLYHISGVYYMGRNHVLLVKAAVRSGAAFDIAYFNDLDKIDIDRYKCVIFANVVFMDKARRDLVRKRVCGGGRYVVFIGLDGYSNGEKLDPDLISDISGIALREDNAKRLDIPTEQYSAFVSVRPALAESAVFLPPGGVPAPVFAVRDDKADKAAWFIDGTASRLNKAAAAHKDFGSWCSWYFSLLPADNYILRDLFQQAGAHIYSKDGDSLLAGNGLVMVNCVRGGQKTVTLTNGSTVNFEMKDYTTFLLDAVTGEFVLN
jgi:hypothetical protein